MQIRYLTGNGGCICMQTGTNKSWCAAENIGSGKVLEKAGMRLVRAETGSLRAGEKVYDKLIFGFKG